MKPVMASPKEAIQSGWLIVKRNWAFFFVVMLIFFTINGVIGAIESPYLTTSRGVINSINFIINSLFVLGFVRLAFQFLDHKKSHIAEFVTTYRPLVSYIIATLIYSLIVAILLMPFGFILLTLLLSSSTFTSFISIVLIASVLILLLIPVTFFAVRFQLYPYVIVDQGVGALAALKKINQLAKGTWWRLFIFDLFIILLNLAALMPFTIVLNSNALPNQLWAVPFLIGLFVTIPLTWVAQAHIYRQLKQGSGQ